MRDGRCVAFQRLTAVLFFQDFRLKSQLIHVMCHVLKVDCDCRLFEVLDFFGSYHGIGLVYFVTHFGVQVLNRRHTLSLENIAGVAIIVISKLLDNDLL